jgi:hypothetical protein
MRCFDIACGGGAMWVTTAGLAAYSIKSQADMDEKRFPYGCHGCIRFCSPMINFTIPDQVPATYRRWFITG